MRRLTPVLCAVSLAALAAACAPVTAFQGYQPVDVRPAEIKAGADSKTTVRTKLGSPTTVSTFEPNIWYYMAQTTDAFGAYTPRTRTREIVAITFDKTTEQVARVDTLTAKDGRVIAFNGRATPTVGRELGIFEQLISNVGTQMLPQQDDDPGRRPNQ